MTLMETSAFEAPRIASLLKHFAAIKDFRDGWRVAHPLPEVLLLAVCGTIAAGDDYEDIVDWGNARLSFLRGFLPFYHRSLLPRAALPHHLGTLGEVARNHWLIENALHWVLDVTFKEDLSRLRKGHGALNMAMVRHFALDLVRRHADKKSIKRRRKCAALDGRYLAQMLGIDPR